MNWLIAHLIGDYLRQSDWMAMNKKKSSLPCLVHCLIYTSVVWTLTAWPMWALVVIFATHFAIDRTWFVKWFMSLYSVRFIDEPFWPWSYVIVDNTWHLIVSFVISLACGSGLVFGIW